MNRILRFSMMCLLSLIYGTTFAQTGTNVTFDFFTNDQSNPVDNSSDLDLFKLPGVSWDAAKEDDAPAKYKVLNTDGDFTKDKTITKDGVYFTIPARNDGKDPQNRIYYSYLNGKTNIRVYQGIVTISAPGHKITTITFSNGSWNKNNTVSSGSYSSGVWTGKAETVEITIGGSTQFANITVTLDRGEPKTYEVNVAEALDAASGLEANETSYDLYQVTGYVVGKPEYQRKEDNSLWGNVNLYLADTKGGKPTLYVYRANSKDNELFTEETLDLFEEGDLVVFIGKLQNFVKDGVSTLELKNGYLVSVSASGTIITGINEMKAQDSSSEIYTIGGIRVKNAQQKGVYIINGKKVVK